MRYTSTRSHDIDCSFEEAITQGYAADGGLFVPRSLPILTGAMLNEWSKLTYPQLLGAVVRLFISRDEVTDKELQTVCESAMDGFADPSHAVPIVPLKAVATDKTSEVTETATAESSTVQDESSATFYVAELFHGPTFCFKDLGMRAVIQLLSLFATKRQRPITLLVSTTGDTGPAALRAVADLPSNRDINDAKSAKVNDTASAARIKIAVHYPHEQISDFQRRQMTTVVSPSSVRVVAFEGGGDDMDVPIKNLLASKDKSNLSISVWTGVNSYNIVRIVYYAVIRLSPSFEVDSVLCTWYYVVIRLSLFLCYL
jgi:threonine synthase